MKLDSGEIVAAQAPNRRRRSVFIIGTVLLAYVSINLIVHFGPDNALSKTAIEGFSSYMTLVSLGYLVGHSVDRNGFLDKLKGLIK